MGRMESAVQTTNTPVTNTVSINNPTTPNNTTTTNAATAATTPGNPNQATGPQGNTVINGSVTNTAANLEMNKDLNMYKAVLKNELLGTNIDTLTSSVLQPRKVTSVFKVR